MQWYCHCRWWHIWLNLYVTIVNPVGIHFVQSPLSHTNFLFITWTPWKTANTYDNNVFPSFHRYQRPSDWRRLDMSDRCLIYLDPSIFSICVCLVCVIASIAKTQYISGAITYDTAANILRQHILFSHHPQSISIYKRRITIFKWKDVLASCETILCHDHHKLLYFNQVNHPLYSASNTIKFSSDLIWHISNFNHFFHTMYIYLFTLPGQTFVIQTF